MGLLPSILHPGGEPLLSFVLYPFSMPYEESYFSTHTYKDVSFSRFSQYWWSNRFYAILARRYGERGASLLEVGSGLGHLVGQLEGYFKTYALDLNFWALRQSRKTALKLFLCQASAQQLPFADDYFGIVIIKHIVEHLPDPERAIAELSRVIAPGGILLLSTPNLDSLLKPLKGEKWIGYLDPTHISLKSPAEWLVLIRKAGFTLLRVFSDGFWDVPYISYVPRIVQKLFFGALGGFQAVTGWVFLPLRFGESMMIVARRALNHTG